MNIQNVISTLLLCCITIISVAQHQSYLTKGTIPEEDIERVNKFLPPHLKLNETGKLIQIASRNQVSLWDSTIHYRYDENTLTWDLTNKSKAIAYDDMGRLEETENYFYPNNTNPNDLLLKTIFIYGTNNYRDSLIGYRWNGTQWETSSITTYDYDSNNFLTNFETYSYNSAAMQLIPDYKQVYVFDNIGRLINNKTYYNNPINNSWIEGNARDISYNLNNQVNALIRYSNWDSAINSWNTIVKDSIFYDNNNYIFRTISYDVNDNITDRTNHLTNSSGYPVERIGQSWSAATQSWTNIAKDIIVYNGNNELVEILYQYWDGTQWENQIKKSYILTGFGETDIADFYRWENNAWFKYSQTDVNYNNYQQDIRWYYEFRNVNTGNTIRNGSFYYDKYYSLKTVNTTPQINKTLNIYPNPVDEIVHIVLPDDVNNAVINIWDLQGKLVHQEDYTQNRINIANLTKGIYILKVNTDTTSYTTKIIKE